MILEQTAIENDGLCARCYQRKNPKPAAESEETPYEKELRIPVAELTDRQKRDQLEGAIRFENVSRISELLSTGNEFICRAPHSTSTWLGEAVEHGGNLQILQKLLAAGCDVNSQTRSTDQTTPLQIAVRRENPEAIAWLLQQGADPDLGRPLVGAVHYQISPELQQRMLTLLLEAGADINQSYSLYDDESTRFTVLDWALLYDIAPEVVSFLRERGAKQQLDSDQLAAMKRDLKPRKVVG